eukprot:10464402-Karenia_brevis.AAC.1
MFVRRCPNGATFSLHDAHVFDYYVFAKEGQSSRPLRSCASTHTVIHRCIPKSIWLRSCRKAITHSMLHLGIRWNRIKSGSVVLKRMLSNLLDTVKSDNFARPIFMTRTTVEPSLQDIFFVTYSFMHGRSQE